MHSKLVRSAIVVLGFVPQALAQEPFVLREDRTRIPRVWIVDDDGPADFAHLQDAVDAASSGDLIRVRVDLPLNPLGPFEEAVVDGKGLVVLAEPDQARIAHRLAVRNLPADESFTVRNASIGYSRPYNLLIPAPLSPPTLDLESNAGTIWVEGCTIDFTEGLAALTFYNPSQSHGIQVIDSPRCVLVRTSVVALSNSLAYPENPPNRSGLRLSGAGAHVYECSFEGMRGTLSRSVPSIGGDGGIVADSFLFAAGSSFLGGAAGYGVVAGDGITVEGSSAAHALDCTFTGGPKYGGPFIPCGIPGQPITGPIELLAGVARSYRIEPPVPTNGMATLIASGPAGETLVSIIAREPGPAYLPQHLGSSLLAPPFTIQIEGTIPASGILVQPVALPAPPPGVPFAVSYRQGLFLAPGGDAFLASASVVVAQP